MRDNKLFALFGLVLLIVAGLWLAIAPEVIATPPPSTYRTILFDQPHAVEEASAVEMPAWAYDGEPVP